MVKAAICRDFKQALSVEDITLDAPQANEVSVKLAACAICHSDIFYMDGAWGGVLPAVYGHEASGTIEAVGSLVTNYKVGEKVLVTLIRSCGHCHSCLQGEQVLCSHDFPRESNSALKDKNGKSITQGLRTAAFAEKVVVDQSQIVHLRDNQGESDIPMDVASLLSCGVITGLGAVVNTAKMRFGASVVVIGCGGVGLNTIQGARLAGAAEIIAVDIEPEKLKIAEKFGATIGLNPKEGDLRAMIKKATAGKMADYVFVTVGAKQAFDQAPSLIGRKGKVVLVGMPPTGVTSEYDPSMIAALGQEVIGSKMGDTILPLDIPNLLTLYRQGRLKLDELVSNRYPLSEINQAIDEVRKGKVLRNVIIF